MFGSYVGNTQIEATPKYSMIKMLVSLHISFKLNELLFWVGIGDIF